MFIVLDIFFQSILYLQSIVTLFGNCIFSSDVLFNLISFSPEYIASGTFITNVVLLPIPSNISPYSLAICVNFFPKSNVVKLLHLLNIEFMSSTLLMSKLLISNVVIALHPENIAPIYTVLLVLKLLTFIVVSF